jgi:UDP-2-acetamido-2-deoxy-ribo-hexuluronate aminotransferase
VFTNDAELAQRMRQIRNHGQAKKHDHPILGLNGRLDTLQAAILLAKLEVFEQEITQRQAVAERYTAALSNAPLTTPTVAPENTSVWAQYTVLSPARDTLRERLQAERIPSVSYYAVPLHLQPVFAELNHKPGDFPVAEQVAIEGLSLPMSVGLPEEVIERIGYVSAGTEQSST